jgi:hypothetical protein
VRTHLNRFRYLSGIRRETGPGTEVTIEWTEWTGETTTNPVTGEKTGTAARVTDTIQAFVHILNPSYTVVRTFNETQVGDAILDLDPDIDLSGKEDLVFRFAGSDWVQKQVGQKLAEAWDVIFGDQRLARTVLVAKKT